MTTPEASWTTVSKLSASRHKAPAISPLVGDIDSSSDAGQSANIPDFTSIGLITGVVGKAVDATARDRRERLLGSHIGPYNLSSILGFGGTGTVYLGERIDQRYSACVAIKIIDCAPLSDEITRRFEAERQILAHLNHPNICRLIDAGETEHGYPYLIMEYVNGESIVRYCDRHKLNVTQRIRLALKVCDAVQYAHQNLVVHRDLKPSNVLVTPEGTPKLLDFGIAKLLDTSGSASSQALTRINDRLITPEYASPEQILGQSVSTASDVYSFGMVLFELLTGTRPYGIPCGGQLQLERAICLTDVPRASAIVRRTINSTTSLSRKKQATAIFDARRTTAKALAAQLTGDVDSILLRALRKEPAQRYRTMEQLADDLQRLLNREPVSARQGNWVYLTQRFVRRHLIGVGIATAFVIILSGALILTQLQARRIERERIVATQQRDIATQQSKRAEAVANFMTSVLSRLDPDNSVEGQLPQSAIELLDTATKRIHNELGQQPEIKARLLETIALAYTGQGQADRGIGLVREALQIRLRTKPIDFAALAENYLSLGKALRSHSEFNAAESALRHAYSILQQHNLDNTETYANTLLQIGRVKLELGNTNEARNFLQLAGQSTRTIYGDRSPEYAGVLVSIAHTYDWESDFTSALSFARRAVEIYQVTLPEKQPDRIDSENQVGDYLIILGHADQAAPILEHSLRSLRKIFGNTSTRITWNLDILIELRRAQRRFADAEELARETLKIDTLRLKPASPYIGYSHSALGAILLLRGKYHAAESELRKALDIYKQSLQPDHPYVPSAEYYLAETLLAEGRVDEAIAEADSAIAHLKTHNNGAWRIARSENTRAQAWWLQNKHSLAMPILERTYRILSTTAGPDRDTVELARKRFENASAFMASRGLASRHSQNDVRVESDGKDLHPTSGIRHDLPDKEIAGVRS